MSEGRPESRAPAGGAAHLGEMASVMAHEVRNVLAGIGSAVEVIGQGFAADSEERAAVDEVRRRVLDLDAMAHELVRFARPRPLQRAPLSVRALLGESVRGGLDALSPPLSLEIHGPDVVLFADAELLAGALLHLCERASRASPSRAVRVTLAASPSAVELRVEPAVESRFSSPGRDPFGFDPSTGGRGASGGDGLGLAVARRIAEAHCGQLSPSSGRGAVTLTLPPSGLAAATPSE